ncbi:MAG: septal ring lytic transglycosylase RlpA family protein [Acidobacteriota bacterium]
MRSFVWVFAVQLLCVAALASFVVGCASSRVPTEPTKARSTGWTEKGDASWYGEPYHGRRTASGEVYDMHEMTAAHRSLPFGTEVRVKRRDTEAEVEVRITDRGPFIKGRIIDLSFAAAKVIGLDIDGVAPVKLKVIGRSRTPKPTVNDQPVPQHGGEDCLWVQVGAFGDPTNARRAVERLKDSGEKVLLMEGPDGLERVRVGPFQTGSEAAGALRRLFDEWPSARIVECGG